MWSHTADSTLIRGAQRPQPGSATLKSEIRLSRPALQQKLYSRFRNSSLAELNHIVGAALVPLSRKLARINGFFENEKDFES